MDLNSPPSHFDHHHPFLPNRSSSSSSSSVSCHFFFDSTRDHAGLICDQRRLYQPNHDPDDQNYGYNNNHGGSTYEMKNKVDSGVTFSLWKKEDDDDDYIHGNPMTKWMSSKMRVMQKMKTADHDHRVTSSSNNGDQKLQPSSSSPPETDLSSNSSSYNNSPIRVCSDCNTTKTPLWRSGPKGPKSLCNACGIRQRKARRAMAAAAAAAANGAPANTASDQPAATATKIKLQHKGKNGKNGPASQLKKRCKTAATSAAAVSPSNEKKRLGFEDFLINLSKNLAFHRVFPDDERDAAILLMALSSGLVNGIN
ncbi:hypothetical protein C2S51_034597 [Perilla frutescens var. frutescens]|nr:hypothetical protein C2S51_034597 [Perilla frutescens var. frutescens]